jgi:excisionase family DNA binding protein
MSIASTGLGKDEGRQGRPNQHIDRLTYDVPEAGRLLGLGRNAAYEAVRTGQLPVIKIGSRLLVPKIALDRLLKGESAA